MNDRRQISLQVNVALQVALCFTAICLYTMTLNRDVQPADSGEFQIVAFTLGIPHPPGYPLFSILGWVFSQLPIGTVYARISFLSVAASAAAVLMVSITVQQLSAATRLVIGGLEVRISKWAGVLFGLFSATVLATSTTFWSQATTTNIRSLTTLFTALMILALVFFYKCDESDFRRQRRALGLFAVAFGLGIGHHLSLIFIGAMMGLFAIILIIRRKLPVSLVIPAGMWFVGTQVIWLYLPIRDAAGAMFAPGNLTTVNGLLYHIFARGFAGDMLAFATPQYLFDRLAILPTLFQFEYSQPVLALILLSAFTLLLRDRGINQILWASLFIHLFITITYRAPQTVEYALPAWVLMSVLMGVGGVVLCSLLIYFVDTTLRRVRQKADVVLSRFTVLALVALVCSVCIVHDALERLPSFVALAADTSVRDEASTSLTTVPIHSNILAQWHQATPMWALQEIEGLRKDVHVEYVYPNGAQPYAETFIDHAAQSLQKGETFISSYFEAELNARRLLASPQQAIHLWQVSPNPISTSDTNSTMLEFDQHIDVARPLFSASTVRAGGVLDVIVTWRLSASGSRDEALSVRILQGDGRLGANADVRVNQSQLVGTWLSKRLRMGIPSNLAPGAYKVYLEAYRTESNRFVSLAVTDHSTDSDISIEVMAADQPAITLHPLSLRFPYDAELMGVDYDTGIPGRWRLLTHWMLPTQPITVAMMNTMDEPAGATQSLPARSPSARYFTLVHDIAPTLGLHLIGVDTGVSYAIPDGAPGERYIPFADQFVMTGVSSVRDGTQLKVDVWWRAIKPIFRDYVMSVRVSGEGFSAAHDSVPVLGALPTLKWIQDTAVMDRHVFTVASPNTKLSGVVVVYDSVTQQILPALDERYLDGITLNVR